MSEVEPPINEGENRRKLERGSEDWNLFHLLIETIPDFLEGATARKLKKSYPQFSIYHTQTLNTCIQNTRKQKKKKDASTRKENENNVEKKEEPTVAERSKFYRVKNWFVVVLLNKQFLTHFFFSL